MTRRQSEAISTEVSIAWDFASRSLREKHELMVSKILVIFSCFSQIKTEGSWLDAPVSVKYISKQTLKYVAYSFARAEMTMKRIVAVKSEEVWRWSWWLRSAPAVALFWLWGGWVGRCRCIGGSVEHFVIGPDAGHEPKPQQWPSEGGVASFQTSLLTSLGEDTTPPKHFIKGDKSTQQESSHKNWFMKWGGCVAAKKKRIIILFWNEGYLSSILISPSDAMMAVHHHAVSPHQYRLYVPRIRDSQQTISRCGIDAAKTFSTGGQPSHKPVDHCLVFLYFGVLLGVFWYC